MSCGFLFLFFITFVSGNNITHDGNKDCDSFHANFNLKKVMGSWYVVAIIPEKMFPKTKDRVTCYRIELSETDVAGLRWLVNKTLSVPKQELLNRIEGTIVRQRFHAQPPFDVWAKSVSGVSGCFKQVLVLDTHKKDLNQALTHEEMMQLHLMDTKEHGQFLLQMLWGEMISVIIYRRKPGVTEEQLRPVSELVNKLRGPQLQPKICEMSLKDILELKQS